MANPSRSIDTSDTGGTEDTLRTELQQLGTNAPVLNGAARPEAEHEMLESERRRANQAERFAATLARIGAAPDLRSALAVLARDAISISRGDCGAIRAYGLEDGSTGSLAY